MIILQTAKIAQNWSNASFEQQKKVEVTSRNGGRDNSCLVKWTVTNSQSYLCPPLYWRNCNRTNNIAILLSCLMPWMHKMTLLQQAKRLCLCPTTMEWNNPTFLGSYFALIIITRRFKLFTIPTSDIKIQWGWHKEGYWQIDQQAPLPTSSATQGPWVGAKLGMALTNEDVSLPGWPHIAWLPPLALAEAPVPGPGHHHLILLEGRGGVKLSGILWRFSQQLLKWNYLVFGEISDLIQPISCELSIKIQTSCYFPSDKH